jgi:uncharacterized LabA/DUF88 family protein
MKYAVLIDGGFIKRKLGSEAAPMRIEHVMEFLQRLGAHEQLALHTLHRIYWYDAPPLESIVRRPLNGGMVNFGSTAQARENRALLRHLCAMPHISVRRGDLVFRGWRIRRGRLPERASSVSICANDLEPHIQQKGVDMRIGLDIAALTMKSHAQIIVLLGGDSDFVPAMKFARREGAQIYLITLGHTVRPEMLEHADLLLELPDADSSAEMQDVRAA